MNRGKLLRRVVWLVVSGFVVLAVAGMSGLVFVIEIPIKLVTGWALFLFRVVPEIEWNLVEILFSLGLGVIVALGAHWFLARLFARGRWQLRWTLSGLALIVVLFSTSIASAGIVHQLVWLVREQPLLASSWAGRNLESEAGRLVSDLVRRAPRLDATEIPRALASDHDLRHRYERFHLVFLESGRLLIFPRDHGERLTKGAVLVDLATEQPSSEWIAPEELVDRLATLTSPGVESAR